MGRRCGDAGGVRIPRTQKRTQGARARARARAGTGMCARAREHSAIAHTRTRARTHVHALTLGTCPLLPVPFSAPRVTWPPFTAVLRPSYVPQVLDLRLNLEGTRACSWHTLAATRHDATACNAHSDGVPLPTRALHAQSSIATCVSQCCVGRLPIMNLVLSGLEPQA